MDERNEKSEWEEENDNKKRTSEQRRWKERRGVGLWPDEWLEE